MRQITIFKRILSLLTVTMGILLLSSCPQQVTAPMAALVEDELPPSIIISSPKSGDNYYSVVTISGFIFDDVVEEGDNAGQITSIYYEITNDDYRKAKIDIGLDDQVTADENFGDGSIDYDVSTGEFSFTFSTIQPNSLRDLLSLTITAVDRNYNRYTTQLSLMESDGPFIEFNFYESADYSEGSRITSLEGNRVYIAGTVGNSEYEMDTANEIAEISWSIEGGGNRGGTLDITEGSEDWIEAEGVFRTTNNVDTTKYFTYDPETRIFTTQTQIDVSNETKYINFTATDIYGHSTTETNSISKPADFELYTNTSDDFYFSSRTDSADTTISIPFLLIDPNQDAITDSRISKVTCSLSSTGSDTPPGDWDDYDSATDTFSDYFTVEVGSNYQATFNVNIDSDSTFHNYTANLWLIVTVTTIEGTEESTLDTSYLIYRDPDYPSITVNSFSGGTSNYVATGDELNLSFTVSDTGGGVDDIEDLYINGDYYSNTDADVTNNISKSGNNYSLSYTFPSQAMADDSGDQFGYSILIYDEAGNPRLTENLTAKTYYDDYNNNICVSDSLNYSTSDTNPDHPTWARATSTAHDEISLTFESARVLSGTPVVTIAGRPAAVDSSSAPEYTATFTTGNGESLNEGEVIPFTVSVTDITGNPDSFSNLDGGTYDSGFSSLYYDDVAPSTPSQPTSSIAVKSGHQYLNSTDLGGNITIRAPYALDSGSNGDAVKLFVGSTSSTAVGTGVYNNTDLYTDITFSGSELSGEGQGDVNFLATITDTAGNISTASSALTLTIDTLVPTITAIADQGPYRDNTLSVTPSCSGTGSNIESYSWAVTEGGSPVDTLTASDFGVNDGAGTLTLATNGDDDGSYDVSLTVTDEAGNTSLPEPFSFIWDAEAFSISSITGLSADSFYSSSINDVTAVLSGDESGTPYIQWSSTDGTFNFSPDNALVTDITSPSDDNENVTVTIRDAFGREDTATITNVTWDTEDPVVDPITDDQGYKAAPFTVTAGANDGSGISNYQWTVEKDGSPFDVVNQGSAGFAVNEGVNTLSLATNGDDDGFYEVSLVVTDGAGNTNATAETFNFTLDAAQFTMSVTGLSSNSFYSSTINNIEAVLTGNESGTSSIAWTASNSADFSFSDSGSLTTNLSSSAANSTTSVTITVIDNMTRTRTVTLTSVGYDSLDPTISNITDQGDHRLPFSVDPSSNVDGTGSGIASYSWAVTQGGSDVDTITTSVFSVNGGAGSLNLATNGDDDGTYDVALTVTDEAGNTNSTAETFNFTWDTEGPSITAIADQGPFNGAFSVTPNYNDGVSDIASAVWSATKDGSSITLDDSATTKFCVNEDEDSLLLTTTADDGSDDGAYEVTLTVTDNAGNISTESFTFEWDNKQFTGSITGISEGSVTGSDTFALLADIDGCESGVQSYAWSSTEPVPSANPSFTPSGAANPTFSTNADGEHTVTLVVTDELGRDDTYTVTFTVDTTDPVVNDIVIADGGALPYSFTADITEANMGTYAWSISASDASTPTLTGPTTANPTLEHFFSGVTYTIGLVLTDEAGHVMGTAYTENFTAAVDRALSNTGFNLKPDFSASDTEPRSSGISRDRYSFIQNAAYAIEKPEQPAPESKAAVIKPAAYNSGYSGGLYRNMESVIQAVSPEKPTHETAHNDESTTVEEPGFTEETTAQNSSNTDTVINSTGGSSNAKALSTKAFDAAAGSRTVQAENMNVEEENKKSAAIPAVIMLLLGSSGAGIIIRKKRRN